VAYAARIWGDTPEAHTIIDNVGPFTNCALSLLRREDSVAAMTGAAIPDD